MTDLRSLQAPRLSLVSKTGAVRADQLSRIALVSKTGAIRSDQLVRLVLRSTAGTAVTAARRRNFMSFTP